MKPTKHFICLLTAICLISCSKDNEPSDVNPDSNSSKVTINIDGSTSTGATFSLIDGSTFYLDYIKYEIVDSHLEIVGHDPIELKGDIAPYAEVTYLGTTYKTRVICDDAFYKSKITSVVIPSTVTKIDWAFGSCDQLVSVTFPETMDKISGFSYCKSLTQIKLPKSVKTIGGFSGCSSLKSIEFPESVESIWGFDHCESLVSVEFPESVEYIEGFSYCKSLASVSLPNSVITVGGFNENPLIQSIYIPASVQEIELQEIYLDYDWDRHYLAFYPIPEIWITNCEEILDNSNNYYFSDLFKGATLHVKPEEVEFCKRYSPYDYAAEIIGDYYDYKK